MGKAERKSSSSKDGLNSSDEKQGKRSPSTGRKRLMRRLEKEQKAKADALRKKMTSSKVKSGLGAAIDAEDPKTRRSEEQESDQGFESEPDTDGNVGGNGISDKQKEDDGNQPVAYVKNPFLG